MYLLKMVFYLMRLRSFLTSKRFELTRLRSLGFHSTRLRWNLAKPRLSLLRLYLLRLGWSLTKLRPFSTGTRFVEPKEFYFENPNLVDRDPW